MRSETESIVKVLEKSFDKIEKNAVKQLKTDSKSDNYKTLDAITRSVAKSADGNKPAPELKKVKDICNKFDRSETVSRADVEKVAKTALAYLLSLPKEDVEKKQKGKSKQHEVPVES